MFKTLFGFIVLVVLALVTGGLYLKLRSKENRSNDWKQVRNVPGKMYNSIRAIGSYFKKLFASEPEAARQAA